MFLDYTNVHTGICVKCDYYVPNCKLSSVVRYDGHCVKRTTCGYNISFKRIPMLTIDRKKTTRQNYL